MIIKKLILYKYKRFSLNSIEYLEYVPEQKVQLILGTNGSGKSSLLAQLSPLPAAHTDFFKEGYKHIVIEHRGSYYELQNNFLTSGNRYQFIKDGEELNKGGTVTVFKELVQQEFGITQEIYDLLCGTTMFHAMTPNDRRKWLTLISDSDYTYAFNYYNKLKDQLKELQTAYKLNQSRLVQEKDKILSAEQEALYRVDIDNLKQFITQLIELKQPLINTTVIKERQQSLRQSLQQKSQQVLQLVKQLTIDNKDCQWIDDSIIHYKACEQTGHAQSLTLFNAIQSLEDQYKVLEHTALESYETIDQQILSVSTQIQQLKRQKHISLTFDNPTVALNALSSIQEQLFQIFNELPDNTERLYGIQQYEQLDQQYRNTEKALSVINQQIAERLKLKQSLEHARDHQQQQCPKCHFVWSKGYTEDTYLKVISSLDDLEQQSDATTQTLKNIASSLDAHRARTSLIQQFRLLMYHWSVLEPLWAYMAAEDMVSVNPRRVVALLSELSMDLVLDQQIATHQHQIDELLKLKKMTNEHQELDVHKLKAQIDDYNHQLQEASKMIKESKSKIQYLETQKKLIQQLTTLQSELTALLDEREVSGHKLLLSLKQQALNDSIRLLQLELNKKEQIISKIDIQKGIIEHLESTLEDYQTKQAVLKIAIKELSPTEGLIAKGLTAFINHFVKHINAFIKQIWLYPLELVPVLPDENDDVDLDYKFSVNINDNLVIPDISKGSSAMKEVIDLAFRITSMQYLGMQQYPILADELGVAFDQAHRKSVFYMVSQLMTNASFSQIFLISHYAEQYGSLTNADVNILSASNIHIPQGTQHNTCLTLR